MSRIKVLSHKEDNCAVLHLQGAWNEELIKDLPNEDLHLRPVTSLVGAHSHRSSRAVKVFVYLLLAFAISLNSPTSLIAAPEKSKFNEQLQFDPLVLERLNSITSIPILPVCLKQESDFPCQLTHSFFLPAERTLVIGNWLKLEKKYPDLHKVVQNSINKLNSQIPALPPNHVGNPFLNISTIKPPGKQIPSSVYGLGVVARICQTREEFEKQKSQWNSTRKFLASRGYGLYRLQTVADDFVFLNRQEAEKFMANFIMHPAGPAAISERRDIGNKVLPKALAKSGKYEETFGSKYKCTTLLTVPPMAIVEDNGSLYRYKYQNTVYGVCSVVQPMILVKGDREVDLIRTLSKSDENGNPTAKDIVGAIAKLKRNFKASLIEANRQGLLYEVKSDKKALDAFSPSISSRFESIDIVEQPADSDGPLCSVSFKY